MSGTRFDLTGRRALITGASSGLGRHMARVLAGAGAAVALAARRAPLLDALREEIVAQGGVAQRVLMDVTSAASVTDATEEAATRLGGLDILVSNAGIATGGRFAELPEAAWDLTLDTNLKGAYLAGQAAARFMRPGGGAIVNVASILGLRVAGQVAAYAASKAGLVQLTKAMALEFARDSIRVNALCPGYIETELNRAFFASEAGQAMIRRIPQRRLGQLSDLDAPLLLLCSEAGAYITGIALPVDGGHLVSSL